MTRTAPIRAIGLCDLDIADHATWPTDWLSATVTSNILDPDGLYRELDHPHTDHALACDLCERTMLRIKAHYDGCVAYHCCRTAHPGTYLENGLWTTSHSRLRNLAKACYGKLDGWEDAFHRALNKPGYSHYLDDWYGGKVGLSYTPFLHYCHGSHFIEKMSDMLGGEGKRCWKAIQAQTTPLKLVCRLPMNWILGDRTEGDLLAGYARELLRAYMSWCLWGEIYKSLRAIHVLSDIPTDFIIDLRTLDDGSLSV